MARPTVVDVDNFEDAANGGPYTSPNKDQSAVYIYGDNTDVFRTTTGAIEGSTALTVNSGKGVVNGDYIVTFPHDGLRNHPTSGSVMSILMRDVTGSNNSSQPGLFYGMEEGATLSGYLVHMDTGGLDVERVDNLGNFDTTGIAPSQTGLPTDEWVDVEIAWNVDGNNTHDVTVYSIDGSFNRTGTIASTSGTDATYSGEGVGYAPITGSASAGASWDRVRVTNGTFTSVPMYEDLAEVPESSATKKFTNIAPLDDGTFVLTPRCDPQDANTPIYHYDPATESARSTVTPTGGFGGGEQAETGDIVLAPRESDNVVLYDPVAESLTTGAAHNDPTLDAYLNVRVVEGEDLVIFSPLEAGQFGRYTPSTDTFNDGASISVGGSLAFSGMMRSSITGDYICTPFDSDNVGIYDAITDTYTTGDAHNAGTNNAYSGMVELSDGTMVMCPRDAPNVGLYDPSTDTFTQGAAHNEGTEAFMSADLLPDGRVAFAPKEAGKIGLYDPETDTYEGGARLQFLPQDGGAGLFSEVRLMPDERHAIITPRGANVIGTLRVPFGEGYPVTGTEQTSAASGGGATATLTTSTSATATGQTAAGSGTGATTAATVTATSSGQVAAASGSGATTASSVTTAATGQQSAGFGSPATVSPLVQPTASGQLAAATGSGAIGSTGGGATAIGQTASASGGGATATTAATTAGTGQTTAAFGTGAAGIPSVTSLASGQSLAGFGTGATATLTAPGTATASGQLASAGGTGATATPSVTTALGSGQLASASGQRATVTTAATSSANGQSAAAFGGGATTLTGSVDHRPDLQALVWGSPDIQTLNLD